MRNKLFALLCASLLNFVCLATVSAEEPSPLGNDSVAQMLRWRISESEIIAAIGRSDTKFDLTPSSVKLLKDSGVSDAVLEAMWKATLRSSSTAVPAPAPQETAPPVTKTAAANAKPIPAHTDDRLEAARKVTAATGEIKPYNPPCPPTSKTTRGSGKEKSQRYVELDWDSGSVSPLAVERSGPVCFELHSFNDILYSANFSLKEKQATGNAIDLLKDVISTVTGLSIGSGSATSAAKADKKTQQAGPGGPAPSCPRGLPAHIQTASATATLLQTALSQLEPDKDNAGKFSLVKVSDSKQKWQPIPGKYQDFQAAVSNVIADLHDENADVCTDSILASAEAIVLEAYLPVQQAYPAYASHAMSEHVERFTADLDSTSGYDLTVSATYPSGDVSNGVKTFSLTPGRKIMTASVGFLVTELPARSYSSVTAPTGMANPATQNVLGVDYRDGPRLALTGLLNIYLPNVIVPLNGRRFGLTLSAGPVFDVSNGKADTSRFGLFAGPTLHIRNQFFLTPGVHVGEFADFPQGFTSAGQAIPPNIGTPNAVKRYTARFGFAITYKLKDLGETTTPSNATPQAAAADKNSGGGNKAAAGTGGGSSTTTDTGTGNTGTTK